MKDFNLKRGSILIAFILLGTIVQAQNVGINSSGAAPDGSAMLDIVSTSKGLLIPRMTTAQRTTISSPATGLLVYDTSLGTFYYYDGSTWVPFLDSKIGWELDGNTGTTAGTDYLGTTDAVDLVFKTSATERMRIESTGDVGIGPDAPVRRLEVIGGADATETMLLQVRTDYTSVGTASGIKFVNSTNATSNFGSTELVSERTDRDASGDALFTINVSNGTTMTDRLNIRDDGQVTLSGLSGASDIGTPTGLITTDANGTLGKRQVSFPVGGDVVLWERPTGQPYIRPTGNSNILVYDNSPTQPYGLYYNAGTNTVAAHFETTSSTDPSVAIEGWSTVSGNQTKGYLGYSGSYSFGSPSQSTSGSAVYGVVDDPNRIAGFFRTTGAASFAANINYSDIWMAGYNYTQNASSTNNPAGLYGQLNVTSTTLGGSQRAIWGYSNYQSGSGNTGITIGVQGTAVGDTQDAIGVDGYASSDNETVFGAYFEGVGAGAGYYAFIADDWENRKITGTGAVSEIIPTEKHGRVTLTCPESPEYWYQDYYTVEMNNGVAHVDLDPILVDVIVVDIDNPIRVFATPYEMPYFNGVTVMNQSATGFDLVELNGGDNTGTLQVQVVVKPKTNYGEGRFIQANGPKWTKNMDIPQSKAANSPSAIERKEGIFEWPADWEVYGYNPEDAVKIGEVIPAGPNAGLIKMGDGKYAQGAPASINSQSK